MVKNPPAHAGVTSSIPVLGRSPEKEMATHPSGNPMDRGAWRATVHGAAHESAMTELLNDSNSDGGKVF